MAEAIAAKRTDEVEAQPRRRALGASAAELRALMRHEREIERLAGAHRQRLLRKLDAARATIVEACVLLEAALTRRLAGGEADVAAASWEAIVLKSIGEGLKLMFEPAMHALGFAVGAEVIVIGSEIAVHTAFSVHALRGENDGRRALAEAGHVVARAALRGADHTLAALKACVAALPDEPLAADERLLLAHHAVYESSERYLSPTLLDLVDDEFLEAAHGLPRTDGAAAFAIAAVMARAVDRRLADARCTPGTFEHTLEVGRAPVASALYDAAEALGVDAQIAEQRSERALLAATRP